MILAEYVCQYDEENNGFARWPRHDILASLLWRHGPPAIICPSDEEVTVTYWGRLPDYDDEIAHGNTGHRYWKAGNKTVTQLYQRWKI